MLFSSKIQFLFVFALSFASAAAEDENVKGGGVSRREFNTFVMKFNEKLDYLNDRVDQSKGNNDAFDAAAGAIVANITRAISDSNNEMAKKVEEKHNKIEEKLNNIEEKQNEMESILFRLLNASNTLGGERESDGGGVWSGVTSQCQSMCQAKLTTWATNQTGSQLKTQLEQLELCDSTEPKARNTCHPNPCLYGGKCRPTSTGSQYECVDCPEQTSGSHCQNIECGAGRKCLIPKHTLYTVVETNLTWAEAKVECESLNMTLAMPRDEKSNEFLRKQLMPVYDKYSRLWLGLKRDGGADRWYWLDGSGLGEYTGGWASMKSSTGSSSMFIQLWFLGGSDMWNFGYADERCYPLCET